MTDELELWLGQATRKLASDAAVHVRAEIREHYESAREAAMNAGSTPEAAERSALAALGSAKIANRQYRSVLLTSAEAKVLREANWEARTFCSRPWLKWLLLAAPAGVLGGAAAYFLGGDPAMGRLLLAEGTVMSVSIVPPFLPIYTLSRGRAFRAAKWVAIIVVMGFAISWWWLLFACLWPMVWTEWTRVSIRRKLPVSDWPKQLYI